MSTTVGPLAAGPALSIEGELPGDLEGVYLLHVPGPRAPAGHGLHRVTISGGRARHDLRPSASPLVRHEGLGGQVRPCAYPKIDPRTGEGVAVRADSRPPFLTWTVIGPDGRSSPRRPVEGMARPSVVHDVAITERYVVLVVAPWFVDGGGGSPVWDARAGTRIALVPRDGGPVRWCEDETFWLWHTVNAHDAKDPADPVVDVAVLDYVEWAEPSGATGGPHLARATIDPSAATVRREVLADDAVELPRIDDRLRGRPHRVAAFVANTGRPQPHPVGADALAWYDTATGRVTRWEPEDLRVGGPAFAPDPRSDRPERGWWLTDAARVSTGESSVLVIPAEDPAAGPVAAVRLPLRVPEGGHGRWLPSS
jgi:carotenoid cleavage dioxygenase-like enzyme